MQSLGVYYIYAFLGGVFNGLGVFGAKVLGNMGLSWIEAAALPLTCASLVMFPFAFRDLKNLFSPKIPLYLIFLVILFAILLQIGQIMPLFLNISVSVVVLLLYSQPIWTILINYIFLKNKLKAFEIFSSIIIIFGVVVLVNPWSDFKISIGALFPILGGFALSVLIVIYTFLSRNNVKPLTITFVGNFFMSVPILLAFPILPIFIKDPNMLAFSLDKPFWMWVLIVVYPLIGFSLANIFTCKGAQKVPSLHNGLILLLEPVVGVLLDVGFLGTKLSWNIIVGGLLILAANIFLIIKSANSEQTLKN